jgi:KDO2-lipid IV(A) lauroyltransferase
MAAAADGSAADAARQAAGWTVPALAACSRALPPEVWERVCGMLGLAMGQLPLRDVRRAREHLARAYPDRGPAWAAAAAARAFAHAGRMAGAVIAAFGRDARHGRRRLVVDYPDRLRAAVRRLRAGQGCLVFTGHLGNWELMGRAMGAAMPLTVIGRRLRSPRLDGLVRILRTATGTRQLDQDTDPRRILAELRSGRLVATLADQDIPRLAGCFVPWFGIPAWTPVTPGVLAQSAGAWTVAACYRAGGRWRFHVGPLHPVPRAADRQAAAEAITAAATAEFEALVRRHPAQWAWWHKRWRTRPPAG